jgi:subtilisin family serine protease
MPSASTRDPAGEYFGLRRPRINARKIIKDQGMERPVATYAVLRDRTPATSSPFDSSFERLASLRGFTAQAPSEPDVAVEEISSSSEVLALAAEPQVRAITRVMPTQLVRPFDAASSGAGPTAWGVAAVGADTSPRTGTGVTVVVLDTGVDAAHPAFSGVDIVEQDFSGSGNGTARATAPTVQARSWAEP